MENKKVEDLNVNILYKYTLAGAESGSENANTEDVQ